MPYKLKHKKFSYRLYFSFPLQLVIMQVKYNQLQLLYWIVLTGFVTGTFMGKYGLQYLFLDPEYLGRVNWLSFFITGLACSAFIMAFNISSYLLNSHRFPFLATLSRPFFKYSLNNVIVPFTFLFIYIFNIIRFQYTQQFVPFADVILYVASFFAGYGLLTFIVFRYFLVTNKDIKKMHGIEHSDVDPYAMPMAYKQFLERKHEFASKFPWIWPVETYLSSLTKIKLVRDTSHYSKEHIETVLKQNHFNGAMFELTAFVVFLLIGFLSDYKIVRIPAASSILLLFTIFIMLSGVMRYWLKSWAPTLVILIFVSINFLSQFRIFNSPNAAYGLNYDTTKVIYSHEALSHFSSPELYYKDKSSTIAILEKWKSKWQQRGVEKPKMILLNVSGGGLRAMIFSFRNLQVIDSMMQGQLMDQTVLMTGASGGLIGASYYRELFLTHHDSLMKANRSFKNHFVKNAGRDLLNAPSFSISTNDLFYSFRKFKDGRYCYSRDRAYAWENQLNENFNNVFDKRLRDYYLPEAESKIPMLFITPGILNDGRGLFISPQNISYMTHAFADSSFDRYTTPNGVEFNRVFANHDAGNLRFTSALRMNATFPYITPAVQLPTMPVVEVIDAGMRDNFGIKNSLRFLYVFKDWIKNNTSGVVLVQIRDTYKFSQVTSDSIKTVFQKALGPFGNVTVNLLHQQDYSNDTELEYVRTCFDGQLDFVLFELPDAKENVPLSWHLTENEKSFVKNNVYSPDNKQQLNKLKALIQTK